MRITPHFNLKEFQCKDGTLYPQEWIDERLRPLCMLLEAIRVTIRNRPIIIVSGYRTAAYNRKIGGARKSQHVEGRAADIRVADVSAKELHDEILRMRDELYRATAVRIGGLGLYPGWCHIDTRPGRAFARWAGNRTTTA